MEFPCWTISPVDQQLWNIYNAINSEQPFSPANVPGLTLWLDANNGALNSISPNTPAAQGQTVRRWLDLSGNNLNADQATGANQPILAKLGARGNRVRYSDEPLNAAWVASSGAAKSAGITGPNGETSMQVTFGVSANSGVAQASAAVAGIAQTLYVWMRSVSGATTARISIGEVVSGELALTTTWALYSFSATPTQTFVAIARNNAAGNSDPVYVGRSWLVENTWSPEYVATTSAPVIPDVASLPNAVRFDGVNDFFTITGLSINSAYTAFIVMDVYGSGGAQSAYDAVPPQNSGIYAVYLADRKFRVGKYPAVSSDTLAALSPGNFTSRLINFVQSNTPSRSLYVNGGAVSIDNTTGAGPIAAPQDHYIGRSTSNYLSGVISAITIYNRDLSPSERAYVTNGLKAEFQIP